MSGSSGMRWITVFDDVAGVGHVVLVAPAVGSAGVSGELVIPMVGHTWSQEALNTDLAGGEGPAVGDQIECTYVVERIVGDITWVPSSLDGTPIFWLIRTGVIVYASDGDLGVTPLSLVGINGISPLTSDTVHNDLDGPWLHMWQWAGLNMFNEGAGAADPPAFNDMTGGPVTTHYDIRVNRRIGPMDILCFQVFVSPLSGGVYNPETLNLEVEFFGQMRALVRRYD